MVKAVKAAKRRDRRPRNGGSGNAATPEENGTRMAASLGRGSATAAPERQQQVPDEGEATAAPGGDG